MNNRETIERLRREYPHGATVELLEMNDPYREMPASLRGVVDLIDDAGDIHVNWQNGSSLAAIPGVDRIRRVRVCPRCREEYSAVPATSRVGLGEICPACGVREALDAAGLAGLSETILERIGDTCND